MLGVSFSVQILRSRINKAQNWWQCGLWGRRGKQKETDTLKSIS